MNFLPEIFLNEDCTRNTSGKLLYETSEIADRTDWSFVPAMILNILPSPNLSFTISCFTDFLENGIILFAESIKHTDEMFSPVSAAVIPVFLNEIENLRSLSTVNVEFPLLIVIRSLLIVQILSLRSFVWQEAKNKIAEE